MPDFDSGEQHRRKLSFDDVSQLVERLLVCECVNDEDSRRTVIGELRNTIPGIAIDNASGDDRIQITNIVRACDNYPRGIATLIHIVHFFEKDSYPRQDLDACMQQIFPGLITVEQLENLNKCVKPSLQASSSFWSRTVLENAYKTSTRRQPPLAHTLPELFRAMLSHLADEIMQDDGSIPLFTFVKKLVYETNDQVLRNDLLKWLQQSAEELGIVVAPDLGEEASTDGLSFIQLVLLPNTTQESTTQSFTAQAWVWEKPNRGMRFSTKNDIPFNNDELSIAFSEMISEGMARIGTLQRKPVIEVFLPDELLHVDIGQWTIKRDGKISRPLCKEYPVAVRSLNSIKEQSNSTILKDCKRYWDAFKDRNSIQMSVIGKEYYQQWDEAGFCDLVQAALQQGQIPVLLFVPLPEMLPRKVPLETLRIMSAPVAFWLRSYPENFDEGDAVESLKTLLCNRNFSTLPYDLWNEYITKLLRDKRHIIPHLTVLWDDPYRVPRNPETLISPQTLLNETREAEDRTTGK